MTQQAPAIDTLETTQQLDRILRSRVFEKAQRSQRLLRYLVEATLREPPLVVKEYTLAIDVFDRSPGYDPSVDATVRVEASRMRSRLREYYDEEGREDLLVIDVPRGGYAVTVSRRALPALASLPPFTDNEPNRNVQPPPAALPLASLLCFAIVVGVWLQMRSVRPGNISRKLPVTLAILPIVNQTGDSSLNDAADGLTDDLIRQLSQIPALKLIAHASVFRYRGHTEDPRSIGKSLGVDHVMTGTLHRETNHLSIAAEVLDTRDGSILLNRKYLVENGDFQSAQAGIQRDLVSRLHLETSARDPGSLHSVTSNPEAYREYLQGETLGRNGSPNSLHQAIGHLEKAVALDPQFDLAWSALASSHTLLGVYFEAPRDHMPLARSFAERAIKLNPSLSEAHGTLGLIDFLYDWNPPAAAAEMTAAGAQQAAIGTLTCTAHLMERTGEPRTAEEMLGRMLTYDPQSAALIAELGCVQYYRRNYGAALRYYREALQSDPGSLLPYWGLGKTLNAQQKPDEAIQVLQSFRRRNGFEPPVITAEIGCAFARSGKKLQAVASIHSLVRSAQTSFVDPYLVATVYACMNDRDAAFEWLNKALDIRSPFVISLLTDPKWNDLQSDPRFALLEQQILQGRSTGG